MTALLNAILVFQLFGHSTAVELKSLTVVGNTQTMTVRATNHSSAVRVVVAGFSDGKTATTKHVLLKPGEQAEIRVEGAAGMKPGFIVQGQCRWNKLEVVRWQKD